MSALPKREDLRRLVELLSERDLETAVRVLDGLIALEHDPVLEAFRSAPEDDEELTPEESVALAEADEDIAAGRLYSDDEVCRRLGL